MGRVRRKNAARHQPVKQHAERRQVLLNRGLLEPPLQLFDVGCHMERFNRDQLANLMTIAPGTEPDHGPVIGHPGILVADGGGEEFQKAAGSLGAGVRDEHRDDHARGGRSDYPRP